jgi:hypothetical protein
MKKLEFKDFSMVWSATAKYSVSFIEPNESDLSIAFSDLQRFSLAEINTALAKFRKMPERRLTPSIIESIIIGCFWLSADEAWGVAQKTFDIGRSVVVTDEIANAAERVKSLYTENQKNAAKAAFINIYERLMMQSVSAGKRPCWFLMQLDDRSFGSVNDANKAAILDAVHQGFISTRKANEISDVVGCEINFDGLLKKLIASAPDENTRAKIISLKKMFLLKIGGDNE